MQSSETNMADFHMSTEEFRKLGHELIDFIAEYRENITDYPVLSQREPNETAAMLPLTPPEHGDGLEGFVQDLKDIVMPGITHWQSPNFFAYYSGNSTGPSILGELLSAGFGVNGLLWAASPALTEIETRMLDWLVDLCDLPKHFISTNTGGGAIMDSASSSLVMAATAARFRAVGHGVSPELVAYCSVEAHSSVPKGFRVIGLSEDQVRFINCDETAAMDTEHLAETVKADIAAGKKPFLIVATSGTTSTCGFDPVEKIADIADECGAWLHLDAAFAGSAAVVPELRYVNDGVARVDSYCFNPHKWLLVNFDATAFYVADKAQFTKAVEITPAYLKVDDGEESPVMEYRNWQVPLGRRFRALKLWMVMRWYGAEGLRAHIRNHVAIAEKVTVWAQNHEDLELAFKPGLSLVCVQHKQDDETLKTIVGQINASGDFHLTHTEIDGRYIARIAIGAATTEWRHCAGLLEQIDELCEKHRKG